MRCRSAVWQQMIELNYPHTGWLRLDRDVLEDLAAIGPSRGLTSWEATSRPCWRAMDQQRAMNLDLARDSRRRRALRGLPALPVPGDLAEEPGALAVRRARAARRSCGGAWARSPPCRSQCLLDPTNRERRCFRPGRDHLRALPAAPAPDRCEAAVGRRPFRFRPGGSVIMVEDLISAGTRRSSGSTAGRRSPPGRADRGRNVGDLSTVPGGDRDRAARPPRPAPPWAASSAAAGR